MKSSGCASLQGGGGHGMGPELFTSKWEAFGDGTITALFGGSFVFCFPFLLFFFFFNIFANSNLFTCEQQCTFTI